MSQVQVLPCQPTKTKDVKMWQHKQYKTQFKSYYVQAKNDRVFQLIQAGGKNKKITFESWQAAKKAGWEKVS